MRKWGVNPESHYPKGGFMGGFPLRQIPPVQIFTVTSIAVCSRPIWIEMKTSWKILQQHQSTYLGGPEYTSIEMPPFRPQYINFSEPDFD